MDSGGAGNEEDKSRKRREALDDIVKQLNDEFGAGTCIPLGSSGRIADVEMFSTGILPLDMVLGGGWPRGRVVEIYGHESSGKTSLALYAIAEMHRMNEPVVLIDAEHALDINYAKKLGVDPELLLLVQPNCGEDAISTADKVIRSGHVRLVVIDSVSALVPQAELEGQVGEGALGQLARLMSTALRRLSPVAHKSKCTIIFINQIRNKIGVYGNPETTTGGLALKFHASVRAEIRAVERKKVGTEDVGFRARVRVVKSKVSVPYRVTEFDLMHGRGVPKAGALLDTAESLGVVAKRGSYYYIDGQVCQGRDRTVAFLDENPDVYAALEKSVKERIKEGDAAADGVVAGLASGEEDDDVDLFGEEAGEGVQEEEGDVRMSA